MAILKSRLFVGTLEHTLVSPLASCVACKFTEARASEGYAFKSYMKRVERLAEHHAVEWNAIASASADVETYSAVCENTPTRSLRLTSCSTEIIQRLEMQRAALLRYLKSSADRRSKDDAVGVTNRRAATKRASDRPTVPGNFCRQHLGPR